LIVIRNLMADPDRFGAERVTLIRPEHWWEWFCLPFVGDQWHETYLSSYRLWRLKRQK
jgi:hypothetical protein